MSDYGKKGGTSANAGKKAVTYLVTLPDGVVVKKRCFHTTESDEAGAYLHGGTWYVAGIWPAGSVPANYTALPVAAS